MAPTRTETNPRGGPKPLDLRFGPWTRKWGTTDLRTLVRRLEREVEGRRVAVLLSGGLDSAVATAVLKLAGAEPIAVHVTHDWAWFTPRWSARRIARSLDVELVEIDVTDDLERRLQGAKGRSVCKICKRIMLEKALEVHPIIATGDSGMDSIAGAALDVWKREGTPPEFVQIPKKPVVERGGRVIRPLIRIHEDDVERIAEALDLPVRRVGELGDLRRGWREGCPLQHLDPDVRVTRELMDRVWEVNVEALIRARELGVRVAVKWPSMRVFTSPESAAARRRICETVLLRALTEPRGGTTE